MWITVYTMRGWTQFMPLNHTICPAAEKYNTNED